MEACPQDIKEVHPYSLPILCVYGETAADGVANTIAETSAVVSLCTSRTPAVHHELEAEEGNELDFLCSGTENYNMPFTMKDLHTPLFPLRKYIAMD